MGSYNKGNFGEYNFARRIEEIEELSWFHEKTYFQKDSDSPGNHNIIHNQSINKQEFAHIYLHKGRICYHGDKGNQDT